MLALFTANTGFAGVARPAVQVTSVHTHVTVHTLVASASARRRARHLPPRRLTERVHSNFI